MNKSITSALERLTAITELLYDLEEGYSVTDLSERLSISPSIIRRDLAAIALSREFCGDFYSDNPRFESFDETSELANELISGMLDDMEFNLTQPDFKNDDFLHVIPLSLAEYQALESFSPQTTTNSLYPLFQKKSICPPLSNTTKTYRSMLSEAITQRKTMHISCTSGTGERFQKSILPVALSHNVLDNLVYVISYKNGTYQVYRVDRIRHMRPALQSLPYPTDLRILQNLDYVWGMDYNFQPEVKPVKVRLLIEDTGNVLYKVRRDTANRKYGHLYQENEQWIYEDLVIGLHSFRSWIFSFGSSMLVLEPKVLQDSVLESYRMRDSAIHPTTLL